MEARGHAGDDDNRFDSKDTGAHYTFKTGLSHIYGHKTNRNQHGRAVTEGKWHPIGTAGGARPACMRRACEP